MFRREQPVDLSEALDVKPRQAYIVDTAPLPGGGLKVTADVQRPFWQRVLLGTTVRRKSFQLDPLGRTVFESCTGSKTIRYIIGQLVSRHKLTPAQAQQSVIAFLTTLAARGLIVVPRS